MSDNARPSRASAGAPRRSMPTRSGSAAAPIEVDSSPESQAPASFQSPRKRTTAARTCSRKKARSEAAVPVTAPAPASRYPLRSRSTGDSKPAAKDTATGIDTAVANVPSQAIVTPASPTAPHGIRPRQFHFGTEQMPALYGKGVATCSCAKHANARELVAFEHLKCYGEEFFQHLKERETREYSTYALATSSTRPQGRRHDSSTVSSHASSTNAAKAATDSPESTAAESDISAPATPRPGAVISTKARRQGAKHMRCLEEPSDKLERQPYVTQRMRTVLVSWLVEVAIEYNCSTAAYHLAITLLDQILDCGPTLQERESWSGWNDLEYDSDDEPDWPKHWFVVTRNEFQGLGW